QRMSGIMLELRHRIGHDVTRRRYDHRSDLAPISRTTHLQALFDTGLLIARKRRALARAVPGADFLLARVAEELSERLATVERHFHNAATVFCVTPAASDAVLASGRADKVQRIEADPSFLAGAPGVLAQAETLALEPESI